METPLYNMEKSYNVFIENYKNVWAARFTKNISKRPQYEVSIHNFFKSNDNLLNNISFKDVYSYHKWVVECSNLYKNWVNTIYKYSKKELEDFQKFFVGALGEYFYYLLFTIEKSIPVRNIKTANINYYRFKNVHLLLNKEDWGVDLIGEVDTSENDPNGNLHNAVFQIKFWNKHNKEKIGYDIILHPYGYGVNEYYIDAHQESSVFICYLGDNKSLTWPIQSKDFPLKKNVVYIGEETLNLKINGKLQVFWDEFIKNIKEIKNF